MDYSLERDEKKGRVIIHLNSRIYERGQPTQFNYDTPRKDCPLFINDIFDFIEGVESVYLKQQSLILERVLLSTWGEIVPKVIQILLLNLAPNETAVDVTSQTARNKVLSPQIDIPTKIPNVKQARGSELVEF